jgi:diguanylate cyclase (GGDEF)-like protein
MKNEQFDTLKSTGRMPTPSGVGIRILELTQGDDWSLDDLVDTIQTDPALTGRILRLANSSLAGGMGGVSTTEEAAMRLGVRSLSSIALGFTLVSGNRAGACERFSYEDYWAESLATGVAARRIAEEAGWGDPAEAFTCGLLARIGELALASASPVRYAELLERVEGERANAVELEREFFAIDRHQVGRLLIADWGLPASFSHAVGNFRSMQPTGAGSDAERDLEKVLALAGVIARFVTGDEDRQQLLWARVIHAAKEAGITPDQLVDVCEQVGEAWREWGELMRISTGTPAAVREIEERRCGQANATVTAEGKASTAGAAPGERLTILAVDDEALSLRLLVRHLEKSGHEILAASNGREALRLALDRNPHIVVTDWMMPEMNGLELCQALRRSEACKYTYVILLTGREGEDPTLEGFDAGINDYVTKPFRPRLLLARIRAAERLVRLQHQSEADHAALLEQAAKQEALSRKLEEAAMTDPLTSLPNRRYAMERLVEEWANAERKDCPLSCVMIDIDHFKSVNDTYGHDVGDQVLTETASVLQAASRAGDSCARIGGEEFLVLCPDSDVEGARQCGERLREAVEAHEFIAGGETLVVTVSVGAAQRCDLTPDPDAMLKRADEAVYAAKAAGRNRVVAADDRTNRRRSA